MEPITSLPNRGTHIAPFFVLNDDLHEPRLRKMVEECAEAGFDSIILHPRPGLRTPYLSKAWFAAIGYCLKEAQKLGLKAWLYDEYPWPSGAAGGRVIQRNANFSEKHLHIQRHTLQGGSRVRQALGDTPILEAFLVPLTDNEESQWSSAQVVTASIGMRNTTWITRPWDSRYYYPSDFVKRYDCRRAMEYLAEQVFEDDLPPGRWTLITFSITVGSDFLEPFGHYVDLSSREATEAFLKETHERYRQHFGTKFGSEILGVFTDEPKYRNALPWSSTIEEAWKDYQRDPRALLALLPDSEENKLRQSYRRLTADLYAQNWISPIQDWCQRENLKFIGHISPEEDWWAESRSAGSILQHLRQFSVPGCDLIIPAVGDKSHPVLNLTPSLAASAAAQAGKSHALCEVFGCSNYSLDLQTVKRVTDWLMLFGINFIVPHACFYSLVGPRRFDAPPTFLSPSTLQPFLSEWSGNLRKTASRLGPGRPVDVAIVRPMSHLFGLSEKRKAEADHLFEEAITIAQHLLEHGLSFHWVDDTDITPANLDSGTLRVGHACYRELIVWKNLLPTAALRDLENHAIRLLSPAQAITRQGPLISREGDIRATRDQQGSWFCINLSPMPRTCKLAGTVVHLDGYESRWMEDISAAMTISSRQPLGSAWNIRSHAENTFRLMKWTCGGILHNVGPAYHSLLSESNSAPTVYGPVPESSILEQPRPLIYESSFDWRGASGEVALIVEEGTLDGKWQAFLNDIPLATWKARSDLFGGSEHQLSAYLHPGTNHLRIEVTATDARHGLWLEPVLRGQFIVTKAGSLQTSTESAQGDDWSQIGYPHYSGTMDFEQIVEWHDDGRQEEAWLVFTEPPAGMMEIFVNDRKAGRLLWSPWRISIHDYLKPGMNTLRLRVTNTLQNFIYGEALPSGSLAGAEIQRLNPSAATPHFTLHGAPLEISA